MRERSQRVETAMTTRKAGPSAPSPSRFTLSPSNTADYHSESEYTGSWDSAVSTPDSASSQATSSSTHTILRTPPVAPARPVAQADLDMPLKTTSTSPTCTSPLEFVHSSGASIRRIPITNTPSRPHATYHLHFTPSGGIQSVPATVAEEGGSRRKIVHSLSRKFVRNKRRPGKGASSAGIENQADVEQPSTSSTKWASELASGRTLGSQQTDQHRNPSPGADLTETVKQRRERAAENAIQRMLDADRQQQDQVKRVIQHARGRSVTLTRAASSSPVSSAPEPLFTTMPSSVSAGPCQSLAAYAGPSHRTEVITPPPRSHSITPRAVSPHPPRSQSAAAGVFGASSTSATSNHGECNSSGAFSDNGHISSHRISPEPWLQRDTSGGPTSSYSTSPSSDYTPQFHPTPLRARVSPGMPFASAYDGPSPAPSSHASSSSSADGHLLIPSTSRSFVSRVLNSSRPGPAPTQSPSQTPAFVVSTPDSSASVGRTPPSPFFMRPPVSTSPSRGKGTDLGPVDGLKLPLRSLSITSHSGPSPTAGRISSLAARAAALSTPSRSAARAEAGRQGAMSAPRPQRSASLSMPRPLRSVSLPTMQASPSSTASSSPHGRQRNLAPVTEVEVEEMPVPTVLPEPAAVLTEEPAPMTTARSATILSDIPATVAEAPACPSPSIQLASPLEVVTPMPFSNSTPATGNDLSMAIDLSEFADSASDSGSGPATPSDSHYSESVFSESPPGTPYASVQLARATTITRATASVFTRPSIKKQDSDTTIAEASIVDSVRTVRPVDERPLPDNRGRSESPEDTDTTPTPHHQELRFSNADSLPRPRLYITTTNVNAGVPNGLHPPPRRLSVSTSKSAPDMTRLPSTLAERRARRETTGIASLPESDADVEGSSGSDASRLAPRDEEKHRRRRSRQRYHSEVQHVAEVVDKERILERLSRRPSARSKPWGYL